MQIKERNKKLLLYLFIASAILLLLPVSLFLAVYFGAFGKIHSQEDLKNIQNYLASEVYSEDGKILGKYYWENRSPTTYAQLPHYIIDELIATEDSRFYEHNGVDAIGLLRVFFKTLLMGDKKSGGGSTIGQQLAKNIFKRKNHGILTMPVNKIMEAIYAVRFNNIYSPNEILSMYLNTVPFGEDTYGIKNASLRFFSKPSDSLKIEEGAILIGMLSSPTAYNPRTNPENSLARRNIVINNLVERNYISNSEADSLKKLPLTLHYKNTGMYGDIAPYFMVQIEQLANSLLEKIKKPDGSKYNLYTDGLKIYTPINYKMQEYAVAAMQKHMKAMQALFNRYWKHANPWGKHTAILEWAKRKSKRYKNLREAGINEKEIKKIFNTPVPMDVFSWGGDHKVVLSPMDSIKYYLRFLHNGFLAMQPTTGEIKAWVGGNDYNYFQYDHVTSTRQVGSTFKPIVYASALEHGMNPCDYTENKQQVYEQFGGWSPRNAEDEYGGKYSMKGALEHSINVVSVEILLRAGIDNVLRTARNMGIERNIPRVPSIALGVADISLLEMVSAYCSFANGGKKVDPIFIARIEDKNGKIIYLNKRIKKYQRAMSPQTAYYMTEMLQGVVNEGTASRLREKYKLTGAIAGKTGTTQSQGDGWFIGYTPGLVAGAWVGAESPAIHFNSIVYGQGASMALPIWAYFIQSCKKDNDCKSYTNGSFHLGNNLSPMPDCPPFMEDNLMDQIKNLFTSDPKLRQERRERREKRREERKARRKARMTRQ